MIAELAALVPPGGSIAIVVASPSPWVDAVIAAVRAIARSEALPAIGSVTRGAHVDVWSPAWWQLGARAARASARGRTDRRYEADFAARWVLDAWAAKRKAPGLVIAPSLAARGTLAAARAAGIASALLVDLPMLRALHRDLDAAAADDPASRFLRRFRASARWVARQDAELVLADLVLCRSTYAAQACGRRAVVITPAATPALAGGGRDVLLAGGATARAGLHVAAEAAARAGRRLLARRCEGTEGAHPNVDWLAGPPPPIAAVVAPARCEAHPLELHAAVRAGIPAIATAQAAIPGARVVASTVDALAAALLATAVGGGA